jgi:hypothetical protein
MMRRRLDDLLQAGERCRLGEERLQLGLGKTEGRVREQLDEFRRAPCERDPAAAPLAKSVGAEPRGDCRGIVGADEQVEIAGLRRKGPVDEDAMGRDPVDRAQQVFLILGNGDSSEKGLRDEELRLLYDQTMKRLSGLHPLWRPLDVQS